MTTLYLALLGVLLIVAGSVLFPILVDAWRDLHDLDSEPWGDEWRR